MSGGQITGIFTARASGNSIKIVGGDGFRSINASPSGGAGAVLVSPGGTEVLPAPSVTPVDTTGAGDCFAGVLAAALADGLALADAAKRATRAAALSVTVGGTVDAMPTAAAVAGAFGPTSS